ncbi:[Protein ADP-ribosylarginine] hydrolase [Takifugu flavidus]|uniref:[Protein ADP-ribosylarginine] hydrolase n=1 Tax=Takifugu flavidus TaxID=433684 RepID=A0A5C6PNL1_9TELE|nr:[Protein ADP-ribosylarginine] hydrolase [Takifugu flavidus]
MLDNVGAPNEMTNGVLGDLLPDLDQGITELLDSLRINLVAPDGPKHNVPEVEPALIGEEHRAPVAYLPILVVYGKCQSSSMVPGRDSDSTAVIACCLWGLLYGFQGVPEGNYSKLEYRTRLEKSAEQLYALSH